MQFFCHGLISSEEEMESSITDAFKEMIGFPFSI